MVPGEEKGKGKGIVKGEGVWVLFSMHTDLIEK